MADDKKPARKLLTAVQFEEASPALCAVSYVTKEDFFRLTSLVEMTDEGAAEATYGRWIQTRRVVEEREVEVDPAGLTEDKVLVFVAARYVNSERRRVNVNKREVAKARAIEIERLPAAMRD